jgi:hypothetical protein
MDIDWSKMLQISKQLNILLTVVLSSPANIAASEPHCVRQLPDILSVEVSNHSDLDIQLSSVTEALEENGHTIVSHPDSWDPKLSLTVTKDENGTLVVEAYLSSSIYEHTQKGAKYRYETELLCTEAFGTAAVLQTP